MAIFAKIIHIRDEGNKSHLYLNHSIIQFIFIFSKGQRFCKNPTYLSSTTIFRFASEKIYPAQIKLFLKNKIYR